MTTTPPQYPALPPGFVPIRTYENDLIKWMPLNHGSALCLYDVLFGNASMSSAETAAAIECVFATTHEYIIRAYGAELKPMDFARYDDLCHRGDAALKLMFVLMVEAHEASLRQQIENEAEPCIRPKVREFYRSLAIMVRSIYSTPYTESSMNRIILTALQFCFTAWRMDINGMIHYNNIFAARCDLPPPYEYIVNGDQPTTTTSSTSSFQHQ
jgi:hypothetical protein